ncbi:hypothetical protein V1517DRAFT_334414 [Lipomyces orientalis]|uniref:Uncharacterized protein n=1 Tax=Lipomyces orientalis TaxID=1233043 RepID=A0ACC3TDA0_9ASCO
MIYTTMVYILTVACLLGVLPTLIGADANAVPLDGLAVLADRQEVQQPKRSITLRRDDEECKKVSSVIGTAGEYSVYAFVCGSGTGAFYEAVNAFTSYYKVRYGVEYAYTDTLKHLCNAGGLACAALTAGLRPGQQGATGTGSKRDIMDKSGRFTHNNTTVSYSYIGNHDGSDIYGGVSDSGDGLGFRFIYHNESASSLYVLQEDMLLGQNMSDEMCSAGNGQEKGLSECSQFGC